MREWVDGGIRAGALAVLLSAAVRIVAAPSAMHPPASAQLPAPVSSDATRAPLVPAADPAPVPEPHFTVRRVLDIPGPMRIGDYRWDDRGAPAGPVIVTVDLEAGMLSIFRGGYEIGAAAIVYGGDTKPTPLGAFPITQKDAHHVSNLYHAEMPYMQRLTDDGITIHGTQGIRPGWATHGCVGVPVAFARLLFGQTRVGDLVIVTRGKRLALGEPIVSG